MSGKEFFKKYKRVNNEINRSIRQVYQNIEGSTFGAILKKVEEKETQKYYVKEIVVANIMDRIDYAAKNFA